MVSGSYVYDLGTVAHIDVGAVVAWPYAQEHDTTVILLHGFQAKWWGRIDPSVNQFARFLGNMLGVVESHKMAFVVYSKSEHTAGSIGECAN
ncbi:hypothetical protein K100096D8_00640 [Eggerthella lenta]